LASFFENDGMDRQAGDGEAEEEPVMVPSPPNPKDDSSDEEYIPKYHITPKYSCDEQVYIFLLNDKF
jgi:hypothetical protein